jgi:hypothetical protein
VVQVRGLDHAQNHKAMAVAVKLKVMEGDGIPERSVLGLWGSGMPLVTGGPYPKRHRIMTI